MCIDFIFIQKQLEKDKKLFKTFKCTYQNVNKIYINLFAKTVFLGKYKINMASMKTYM